MIASKKFCYHHIRKRPLLQTACCFLSLFIVDSFLACVRRSMLVPAMNSPYCFPESLCLSLYQYTGTNHVQTPLLIHCRVKFRQHKNDPTQKACPAIVPLASERSGDMPCPPNTPWATSSAELHSTFHLITAGLWTLSITILTLLAIIQRE